MSLRHVLVGTALLTVLTLLGCNGHCCRPTGQCNSAGRTCPASPPDSFIPPGSLTTPAVVTPPPPPVGCRASAQLRHVPAVDTTNTTVKVCRVFAHLSSGLYGKVYRRAPVKSVVDANIHLQVGNECA